MFCDPFFVGKKVMEIIKIANEYNSKSACIKHLERIRWSNEPICPYCNSKTTTKVEKECRHKCRSCNRSFSVLVGTIFEASKLPLQKWFIAIHLILGAKKGISSLQLARHLTINKDTAWYLQRRIRLAMEESSFLKGIVEIDETYVGGSLEKMNRTKTHKKFHKTGMQHKTPVLGMYQRDGKVVLRVLEKANGEHIKPILNDFIAQQSIVITDGFGGYNGLSRYYDNHIVLNHSIKVMAINQYNMSRIEGFWSIVKRAVIGTYHKISYKYMQEYLNEIAFKFNYRHLDGFNLVIENLTKRSIPLSG